MSTEGLLGMQKIHEPAAGTEAAASHSVAVWQLSDAEAAKCMNPGLQNAVIMLCVTAMYW
jgi:hypothetical protein